MTFTCNTQHPETRINTHSTELWRAMSWIFSRFIAFQGQIRHQLTFNHPQGGNSKLLHRLLYKGTMYEEAALNQLQAQTEFAAHYKVCA